MQCEQCNKDIASVEAHSMLVVLQKVDNNGYSFSQCEDGALVDGHTFQHWHCCKEEMVLGVHDCIKSHYADEHLQPVTRSQVRLHILALNASLLCKVCKVPLNVKAYRFCLTVATPVNYVPDDSHDSLSEWCCSLEHASENALRTLERLMDANTK